MEDFNIDFSKNIDSILKDNIIIKYNPSNVCNIFLKKYKSISSHNLLLLLSHFYKINNKNKIYCIISRLLINYINIKLSLLCSDKELFHKSRKLCIYYWGQLMKYFIDN